MRSSPWLKSRSVSLVNAINYNQTAKFMIQIHQPSVKGYKGTRSKKQQHLFHVGSRLWIPHNEHLAVSFLVILHPQAVQ